MEFIKKWIESATQEQLEEKKQEYLSKITDFGGRDSQHITTLIKLIGDELDRRSERTRA